MAFKAASEKLAAKATNVFNAFRGSGADAAVVQEEFKFSMSVWHETLKELDSAGIKGAESVDESAMFNDLLKAVCLHVEDMHDDIRAVVKLVRSRKPASTSDRMILAMAVILESRGEL